MHNATWLEVDGVAVYVEIAGEGPPVLCVHTAGQSGVQYREVLERLPQHGYQVVVLDLPGHGRSSPALDGPVSDLHHYAEVCWNVSEQLALVRPTVVGCSIGGKIVLDLCVHHGAAISAGVAMEADAFNGALSVNGLRRSMSDVASPAQGDRTYFGTLASLGVSVSPPRAERIALMHRREDNLITSSDLIGWTSHDVRSTLGDVQCPVLVVAGSDDFWVRLDEVSRTAAAMPRAAFVLLEGIGHYPMEEIEDFPDLLAEWLGGLARGEFPTGNSRKKDEGRN